MIFLLLVPILCVAAVLILYVALRGVGVFSGYEYEHGGYGRGWLSWSDLRSPSAMLARLDQATWGCMVAAIATVGLWIAGWIVVLVVGLRFLRV